MQNIGKQVDLSVFRGKYILYLIGHLSRLTLVRAHKLTVA